MIRLSPSSVASPELHTVPKDPGTTWVRNAAVAVDAPPDAAVDPPPEAQWPVAAGRTGIYGAVSPRVVTLPGGYRLYYTQILPRPGFPAGANDYDHAATRILSARSGDGVTWIPEPGVRLGPEQLEAGAIRLVSSEVVPAIGDARRLRMYFESTSGTQGEPNAIRSAVSADGGLTWIPEPGVRLGGDGGYYCAPRIVFLEGGQCRLYCSQKGQGIISALSSDGGFTFRREPGVRIAQDGLYDGHTAFAPEILRLEAGGYIMYYAGYSAPNRTYVLRAASSDGLLWRKETSPAIAPGGRWDKAKCSEMSIFPLLGGGYGMVYEGCDGTAPNERGVWRIAAATSAS
jgi:hypothetical protein